MMRRAGFLLAGFAMVLCLAALFVAAHEASAPMPNHNAQGGYIPACGDLPGLVGDDC